MEIWEGCVLLRLVRLSIAAQTRSSNCGRDGASAADPWGDVDRSPDGGALVPDSRNAGQAGTRVRILNFACVVVQRSFVGGHGVWAFFLRLGCFGQGH
jgi:hypothetical protein